MGLKLAVTVVDPRGDMIASARMDGARFITSDISRGKATVAAVFGQPSGELERQKDSSPMQSLFTMNNQGRWVFRRGEVPLTQDGEVIGAIGVSGGIPKQDEDIAKAAGALL